MPVTVEQPQPDRAAAPRLHNCGDGALLTLGQMADGLSVALRHLCEHDDYHDRKHRPHETRHTSIVRARLDACQQFGPFIRRTLCR